MPCAPASTWSNDDTITFPRAVRGSYAFSSLANFLAGTYNNAGFTQTFGDTVVQQGSTSLGLYAQDEWGATPRLTLNLGLRYDLQDLETITTDTNNVSPRVGFAWTPFEARDLVVRGSAGLYFDRVPLRPLANALLSADNSTDLSKLRQLNIALTPGQAGAPVLPGHPRGAGAVSDTLHPHHHAARPAERLLASGEPRNRAPVRQLRHRQRRLFVSARAQPDDADQPERADVCAAGTNNGCRPVAAYANNNQCGRPASRLITPCCCRWRGARAPGATTGPATRCRGREQRRRVLLQRADRSVRPRQGLERADNDRRHLWSSRPASIRRRARRRTVAAPRMASR
jgi:hypothetical protein